MLNEDDVEWRDVVGFEGLYTVSNTGLVRSTGAYIKSRAGKLLQSHPTSTSGYLYVKLWRHNKMHNWSVHRLVATAFIPNPENKPSVNHKDGDKHNNHVSNLEWMTVSENHKHAFTNNLRNADHVRRRNLGRKAGNQSEYHNVSWDSVRGRWKGSVKHQGKMLAQKRFDNEHEAALFVNKVLDMYELTDRPRNIVNEMPNDYPERE